MSPENYPGPAWKSEGYRLEELVREVEKNFVKLGIDLLSSSLFFVHQGPVRLENGESNKYFLRICS